MLALQNPSTGLSKKMTRSQLETSTGRVIAEIRSTSQLVLQTPTLRPRAPWPGRAMNVPEASGKAGIYRLALASLVSRFDLSKCDHVPKTVAF
jgi:hypothetical protein